MSSELEALLLSGALIAAVAVALLSRKVSVSLIALFYAAMVLGVIFTIYGDVLIGLLTMVTFAGAVSVLLLTVILITGEPNLRIGFRRLGLALVPLTTTVGVASFYALYQDHGGSLSAVDSSLNVIEFAWTLRPWDLLILIVVFAAAMVSVTNLLGGEK